MNLTENKLFTNTLAMKIYILLLSLGILFSCNAQKPAAEMRAEISSECPSDGICEIEVLKNKQLVLLYDDLGGMYYDIKDHEGTTVIHYQYTKTTQANLQDGHYREDVIFEIKNSDKSLDLTDTALQQTKLIFGRHCFCKGQTGYFKVEDGDLKLTSTKNGIIFNLRFICDKVPQIINTISTQTK